MKAVVLINYGNQGFLTCSRRDSEQFCFIGGKIEPNETPIEALIRETQEESGIPAHNLQNPYAGYFVTVFLFRW